MMTLPEQDQLKRTWRNAEPVALGGAVTGLATALLAVLSAFGVFEPTPRQFEALMGLVTVLIGVVSFLTRRQVISPYSAAKADVEAAIDPHPEP